MSGNQAVSEKKALQIMSRIARQSDGWVNPFMIGVKYWNGTHPKRKGKPHKSNKKKIMVKEVKLTERRRAREARNWLQAVKLSRKGAGKKLQYKDKNGNPIYGNSMFYFQKVLHQVYPDDEVQGYVAYNKKRNKVRRLTNFFTSDWKKIEIATG